MAFFEDEWRSPILVSGLAAALLELTALDIAGILHVAGALLSTSLPGVRDSIGVGWKTGSGG